MHWTSTLAGRVHDRRRRSAMIAITRPKWIASLFLVIGVGLLLVGAWFGAEAALFSVDGASATGTVAAKRIDPDYYSSTSNSTSDSSIRLDRNGYFVTILFTPDGGAQVSTELLVDADTWNQMTVGQSAAIDYVRTFPAAMNALADQPGGSAGGSLLVGLLALIVGAGFAAFGARFLLGSRHRAALVRRLMAVGVKTTGSVVDNDARELWIRYNFQRKLRYRYTDSAGHEQTGLSDWMPRAEAVGWHLKATGVVRYDSAHPDVSAWFGHDEA